MNQPITLLEYLSYKMQCDYLSDLRCKPQRQDKLYALLADTALEDFPAPQWLDACQYLTQKRAANPQQARAYLLARFEGGALSAAGAGEGARHRAL
ncbi:hypothetical protein H8699_10875 [Christensenellaceae bacterium NSJ-44]|uniref:Uncharacterized protein n=1 Tax=Luoshenia tenuis TaxID=2763654 RepID=A0A926D2A6_9FIRM|nr:hypothetical protein [Luoshenia tenuis]MBC8529931.1 hypothetical protein [Luoshenia tenuis]